MGVNCIEKSLLLPLVAVPSNQPNRTAFFRYMPLGRLGSEKAPKAESSVLSERTAQINGRDLLRDCVPKVFQFVPQCSLGMLFTVDEPNFSGPRLHPFNKAE